MLQKHTTTKTECYKNSNVSHLMKNTHTDKPNYTPSGTHIHTWLHTDIHHYTPENPITYSEAKEKMETHRASPTCTQLYTHTYIKLSINGHLKVLLIQCTVAPLSLSLTPSQAVHLFSCFLCYSPSLSLFSLCTDDYCSCESAVKALLWQEWD